MADRRLLTPSRLWASADAAARPAGDADADGELEPSLGSLSGCILGEHMTQLDWSLGGASDCEQDAGDEPENCDEDGSGESKGGNVFGADEKRQLVSAPW